MFRKFFLLTSLLVVFGARSVSAQEFNYARAYGDYVGKLGEYKTAHSEYLLAKSQYLQAKTLASQTKAEEATSRMLMARDESVSYYLIALKQRLVEAIGISQSDKDGLNLRIDSEKTWFDNHKNTVSGAGTLDDLVEDSNEASEHFTKNTVPLSYEVLSIISLGKGHAMRVDVSNVLSLIKTKVTEVRANNDKDLTIIDRWVQETENKITRSLDKEIEGQTLIFSLQNLDKNAYGRKNDPVGLYNEILADSQDGYQLLKEAVSFMNEVVRAIKYE
jgi:hypothetical protein